MATNRENFKSWYAEVLHMLYPRREAGFVILMVAFPLLERYLRQRLQLPPQSTLQDPFFDELVRFFPELQARTTARDFWQVYRNGLLHEVTLSRQNRSRNQMPVGWLSHDIPKTISCEPDGSFWIHPVRFAERVVQIIEADFTTFDGPPTSPSPLPTVQVLSTATGTTVQQPEPVWLGTNTEP
ncbi:MAG: hypothetical protein AAB403_03365 [Planctomycetota bacterium]